MANLRLAELRSGRGLTLKQLAGEVGVHDSTISRWCNGISAIPDAKKQQLAELFGVSVSFLMGWDEADR